MNLQYLALRLIRHRMSENETRFLLKRRLIIRPGLESTDPLAAANRYIETLSRDGRSIKGKRILLFGYGGRFAVGVELLKQGAAHVVLCDHIESLDEERNLQLLREYSNYLHIVNRLARPRPEFISLLHGDVRDPSIQRRISTVDFVFSASVYEHLDDVPGITRALSQLTKPDGLHLHFIDLRDHYFKYPFEMLMFTEKAWKTFLNPTSNLNRLRLGDYRKIFEQNFQKVSIEALERDEAAFLKGRSRIRPEFVTGDLSVDAVTQILAVVGNPSITG